MIHRLDIPYERKCWGWVKHVFHSHSAAISVLDVEAGTRCSRHYHRQRVNQFTVISGQIVVQEFNFDDPDNLVKETMVGSGQSYAVPVKVVHRFVVRERGQVIEVYWPDDSRDSVTLDDIVRIDEGGPA